MLTLQSHCEERLNIKRNSGFEKKNHIISKYSRESPTMVNARFQNKVEDPRKRENAQPFLSRKFCGFFSNLVLLENMSGL